MQKLAGSCRIDHAGSSTRAGFERRLSPQGLQAIQSLGANVCDPKLSRRVPFVNKWSKSACSLHLDDEVRTNLTTPAQASDHDRRKHSTAEGDPASAASDGARHVTGPGRTRPCRDCIRIPPENQNLSSLPHKPPDADARDQATSCCAQTARPRLVDDAGPGGCILDPPPGARVPRTWSKEGFTVFSYWSSTESTDRPRSEMSRRMRRASRVSASVSTKICNRPAPPRCSARRSGRPRGAPRWNMRRRRRRSQHHTNQDVRTSR